MLTVPTDVSKLDDVQRLKDEAYAALRRGRGADEQCRHRAGRRARGTISSAGGAVLEVNLWGVINGVQTFAQAMIAQGTPGAIVNTGSKQGITTPPGDTAYNVSQGRREGAHRGAGA